MISKTLTSEETVYHKLKTAIRKRYIKQGSKLVETTLADKLGVSRTPVRSAIKRLEVEGLVNSITNRGAFVITPTRKEIEEAFQVRTALEAMAIEQAITKASQEQIDEIWQLIEQEKEILKTKKMEDYWKINDAIHLLIADMSGNSMLKSYIGELLDRTSLYLVLYDPFSRLEYSPTAEHERIARALENGDEKEARAAIVDHLKSSTSNVQVAEELPEDYLVL